MPPSARSRRSIPAPWRAGRSLGQAAVRFGGVMGAGARHGLDRRGLRPRRPDRLALRRDRGLLLAGLGGSTQHPIGSSLVSAAFPGLRSRTALGTYNFTGDLGKMAAAGLIRGDRGVARLAAGPGRDRRRGRRSAPASSWARCSRPTCSAKSAEPKPIAGQDRPWAYWLLFSIHIADDLVRTGFLIFRPSCCATRAPTCRPSASACRCCSPAAPRASS